MCHCSCFFPGTSSSPAEHVTRHQLLHAFNEELLFVLSCVTLSLHAQNIWCRFHLLLVCTDSLVPAWWNSREPACVMPHALDNPFNFSAFLCSSGALHSSSKQKGPRCCCFLPGNWWLDHLSAEDKLLIELDEPNRAQPGILQWAFVLSFHSYKWFARPFIGSHQKAAAAFWSWKGQLDLLLRTSLPIWPGSAQTSFRVILISCATKPKVKLT